MGMIASQITSLAIVYWTVYSNADQRKHQSPASLAFVHKWPVTRKMFPFDDVTMALSGGSFFYQAVEINFVLFCITLSISEKMINFCNVKA